MLAVTGHFTRYAQAFITLSQAAKATVQTLRERYFVYYGFPGAIISDQEWNFKSKLVTELCQLAAINKLGTTPYNPQMNGQCEKSYSLLISML